VADLIFATVYSRLLIANVRSKATPKLYWCPAVLTFVNEPAANLTNVGTGTPASLVRSYRRENLCLPWTLSGGRLRDSCRFIDQTISRGKPYECRNRDTSEFGQVLPSREPVPALDPIRWPSPGQLPVCRPDDLPRRVLHHTKRPTRPAASQDRTPAGNRASWCRWIPNPR